MQNIALVALFLIIPVLIIYLTETYKWIDQVGAIIWAYAIGILLRLLNIVPETSLSPVVEMSEMTIPQWISELTIPIALPLLLFSLDFRKWLKNARKTLLSMILAFISVITMVVLGFYIFGPNLQDGWKISGLLTGVYTGGTPNMAAIKTALEVDQNTYILTHTYDMVISLVWFIFIITVGQRVLNLVLPKSVPSLNSEGEKNTDDFDLAEIDSFKGVFRRKVFLPLLGALGISILIFGSGYALMSLMPENAKTTVIILYITTAGILLSFVRKVNRIKKSFQLGMYFIIVFSMAVASMADLKNLVNISGDLFLYVALAVWGSLILHILLSIIFKVDTDTVIITSTALAFSPPFVPVVAGALRNRDVIITGLTVGIIGYAVGNYLGVSIAAILHSLM
jgi:uncharacterized membrane protein